MITPHYRCRDFDWTSFEALRNCAKMAYDMAGIKNPRQELDLAEVHDCFSITEMCIYEDFGLDVYKRQGGRRWSSRPLIRMR